MTSLFDPIQLGAVTAKNRVLMAPMTRGRATRDYVPTIVMAEYYRQRAGAGLIISEATGISRQGLGWAYAPGIWSEEQVEAWKPITAAVHDAGGIVFCQLWHMGRRVHSDFLNGDEPVSASATKARGKGYTYSGQQDYSQARALRVEEIHDIVADYRNAAKNAIAAGFDGIEVHGANGYLVDQFLRSTANLRDDEYGGSIANRVRLLKEIASGIADTIGADRAAIRLSPNNDVEGVDDHDPENLFAEAGHVLSEIGIAFLELREPREGGTWRQSTRPPIAPTVRNVFKGPLILNSDYNKSEAQAAIEGGKADAIAFGRPFLANPDLPERLAADLPLAKDDPETYYTQGPNGYTDYPDSSGKGSSGTARAAAQ